MMMRPSPKLAKEVSRSYTCTDIFSSCSFHRHLQCGFATRFEVTYCRGERPEPSPVVLKDPFFQSVCKFRRSASSHVLSTTSSVLQEWSSVYINPEKRSKLLSQGVHVNSVNARKGEVLQHGHLSQHRFAHSACAPSIGWTNEGIAVPKSIGSFSSCELFGENKKTQLSGETYSSDGKEVVCTQAVARNDSATTVKLSKKIRRSRRLTGSPEIAQVRIKLNRCSKLADLRGALEVFDQVKEKQQVRLDIHMYNVLLYLCSGAASGKLLQDSRRNKEGTSKAVSLDTIQHDENASKNTEGQEDMDSLKIWVHFSPKDIELGLTRGPDIIEDMLQQDVEPNEASYTSIVRLAVAKNDCDLAFETIKLMESSGIAPKLRSCGPLFLSVCKSNTADKAYEVDDHMVNLGLQLDENMLDSLLKVSTEAGHDDKVYSVLHRLRKSSRDVLPTTVRSIEKWFSSEHAANAGKARWKFLPTKEQLRGATVACGGGYHGLGWLGMGAWQVTRTSIGKNGSCLSCGERLHTIDIDRKDTEEFADSIAKLACKLQRTPNEFESFQEWLYRHGPFEAIIDGANVGLYNPKIYNGFNVSLLQAVIKAASSRFCNRKLPLVVLHSRHRYQIARLPNGNAILNNLRKDCAVYFTPLGSNDDWFWLYAAVKCKCILLTNDKMRDHVFALLGNSFFPKWKERHQVRFSFLAQGLEIHLPPPYSTAIQESESGSWHVPQALQGGEDDSEVPREWLCVTRPAGVSSEI